MSQELSVDISKQAVDSGFLEFFELEIGTGSDNILYFHAGKNENLQDIQYRDQNGAVKTYVALPLMMSGIEYKYDGPSPRPSLTIANVESIIKTSSKFKTEMADGTWDATAGDDALPITKDNFVLDDLIGSKLTRRRTLEKYLTSNPTIEFRRDVYIIDRIEEKTNMLVSFELSSAFDLDGIRIPSRAVVGKYCPWKYQGARSELSDRRGACVWKIKDQIPHSGGATSSVFATENDEPLLLKSAVDATSPVNKDNISSHNIDTFVVDTSSANFHRYYRSRVSSNTATDLGDTTKWQEVRVYTTYSSDASDIVYRVFSGDTRRNSYVLHSNTIWRVLIENTKSDGATPSIGSAYWEKADICGKLLGSCKMRYQAMGINSNTALNFIPSINLDTSRSLPFGGFPGSKKFR